MMAWYVAYGVSILVCAIFLIHSFLRENYFIRLGELVVLLILSSVPVVNLIFVLMHISKCGFWDRIIWPNRHD